VRVGHPAFVGIGAEGYQDGWTGRDERSFGYVRKRWYLSDGLEHHGRRARHPLLVWERGRDSGDLAHERVSKGQA
jgi:hypothetical protein